MNSFGTKGPSADWAEREAALAERAALLEAVCVALNRRQEVFELLEASTDPNRALEEIQDRFGLEPAGPRAVLDLQLRRLTSGERDRIAVELTEVRARLLELRKEPGD